MFVTVVPVVRTRLTANGYNPVGNPVSVTEEESPSKITVRVCVPEFVKDIHLVFVVRSVLSFPVVVAALEIDVLAVNTLLAIINN